MHICHKLVNNLVLDSIFIHNPEEQIPVCCRSRVTLKMYQFRNTCVMIMLKVKRSRIASE